MGEGEQRDLREPREDGDQEKRDKLEDLEPTERQATEVKGGNTRTASSQTAGGTREN